MKLSIIAIGNYWICENMDTLAPIIEEGYEYLLSDTTRIRVPYGKEEPKLAGVPQATEEEKKAYARANYGAIFEGDEIIINRGRKMKGEHKIVKKSFRFYIEGTYGKQYTDYLVFEDGTKVNIDHCDVVGVEYKPTYYRGQEYFYRQLVLKHQLSSLFNVGGRI